MKIGFAQINTTIGDFDGNSRKILAAYLELVQRGTDLVLTPELALSGYPPQDLVFKSRFVPQNLEALEALHAQAGDVPMLAGFIDVNPGAGQPFHNAVALLRKGAPMVKIHKSLAADLRRIRRRPVFRTGKMRRARRDWRCQIRGDHLRGHLDGGLPAAAALRCVAGGIAHGAGRDRHPQLERVSIHHRQGRTPRRDVRRRGHAPSRACFLLQCCRRE